MTIKQAEKLEIGARVQLTDSYVKLFPSRDRSFQASRRGTVAGIYGDNPKIISVRWDRSSKAQDYLPKNLSMAAVD